jgi:16S rRNA (guanine1207-N2)-methyltransferase
MNQYFIENPNLPANERELSLEIFSHTLHFTTNSGLFSCEKIDDASLTLVKKMPPLHGEVLDLGCGYGFIGIALAKANNISLTQSDINGIALNYARRNAQKNAISSTFIHSDGFEKITQLFDTITLNPPIHAGKETMYRLYSDAASHLHPGGSFYIVIQKKHGAESSLKKLNELFAHCEIMYKKKGLFVIKCFNC